MASDYFKGRLKELREQAGLSQKALADRAGLGQATVANIESGRNEPSWPSVVALAEALGVTCLDFLTPPAERPKAGRGRPKKEE